MSGPRSTRLVGAGHSWPSWTTSGVRRQGRTLTSIFFGGGTPSLMTPATAAALIERADHWWRSDPDLEITLEANPTSVEAGRLEGFRSAGINRVSLGVQALDDRDLAFLGRAHSAREALAAVDLAAGLFRRHSFDLIYARPGQTPTAWASELRQALRHCDGHLSVYQLTIEPGTRFQTLHTTGHLALPDEDTQAELYELTQAMLGEAGLPAYEISNHARPGHESRHNLLYWRYDDYAGIGPGAHGRLTLDGRKWATRKARLPERWLNSVERHGDAEVAREHISSTDQLTELMVMGLRLTEGVPLRRIEALCEGSWQAAIDRESLERLMRQSFVVIRNGHIAATADGRQRLDAVLRELLC